MLVGAAAGSREGAAAYAVERRLFTAGSWPRSFLAAMALVERLGAERVVLVGGGSPEEIAAEATRGLIEQGVASMCPESVNEFETEV